MWELGKSEPDIGTIIKLAKYFNVSLEYLLGVSETPTEAEQRLLEVLRDIQKYDEKTRQQTLSKLQNYLTSDEKEKPADEGELEKDVVIYHRDGKTVRRKFTKAQLAMISAMLDAIPDETDENSEL